MKKTLLFVAVALGLTMLVNAQNKAVQTVTIKTPTVQCESCKERIENTMARVEGVTKTVVNYRNKTTK